MNVCGTNKCPDCEKPSIAGVRCDQCRIASIPTDKPPLGLMPQNIWKEKRVLEIVSAMDKYNDQGRSIPGEWFTELYTLIQ